MQYGSIGWAVGAALGYSAALKGKKRLILSIGDGSFQVTAQVCKLNCQAFDLQFNSIAQNATNSETLKWAYEGLKVDI